MPKFRIIVLDCDGVILESVDAKTIAFARVVEKYGDKAKERMIDYHLAHGGVSRFLKFAWFYREVLGRKISESEGKELGSLFNLYCFEEVLSSPFVPGAVEFISEYSGKLPLFIISGTPHEELLEIVKARKIGHFFRGIYGSPPGKSELLAQVIQREGVLPKETLMVGDSSTDFEAAVKLGTYFYGRGKQFNSSKYPWGDDLTGLSGFIAKEGI